MPDPLDLARCRALVSDTERVILTACADIIERQGDGAVRYIGVRVDEVRKPLTALTTALRAACDEVERLRERIAGAEAGIIGKVTARMGWIDMTTAEELIAYLEERDAIRRRALAAREE